MNAYTMYRFTLTAPHVLNHDHATPSGYADRVREGLLAAGIDGWTEYETVGSWRGTREPGTTFEIYATVDHPTEPSYTVKGYAALLDRIGRAAMPDQEAVQVTCDAAPATLWEARQSDDTTPCDECGESIPDDEPDMVNPYHAGACSLHP